MASGWSIWRRSATRVWCRARSRPCSAWKSTPKIRFLSWSLRSETSGCCCCSTIASMSSTRRPVWRRRFSAGARRRHSGDQQGASRRGGRRRVSPRTAQQPASRRLDVTAAEAAAFPAVQLFVERVTAIVEDFALTDANAPLVVEICRRLDGLPLAIEFAAPRVEVLGVEGLAARLDDSLPQLGSRRRAASPRHRTMRAVIDWSYGLLSEDEQRFFRALGIFAGGFTVEAAAAVATDAAKTTHRCDRPTGRSGGEIVGRRRCQRRRPGSDCSTRPAPTRSRSSMRAVSVSGSRAATPSIIAICSSAPKVKRRRGLRANG